MWQGFELWETKIKHLLWFSSLNYNTSNQIVEEGKFWIGISPFWSPRSMNGSWHKSWNWTSMAVHNTKKKHFVADYIHFDKQSHHHLWSHLAKDNQTQTWPTYRCDQQFRGITGSEEPMDDTKGMRARNPCCGELQRPPFSFTFKFYFIWKLTKFIILIFKRYGTIAEMHKYNIHLEITYNKIGMTLYENSHTLYINLRFGHSSPSHFSLETGEPYWDTVHRIHDETGFHYRQFL